MSTAAAPAELHRYRLAAATVGGEVPRLVAELGQTHSSLVEPLAFFVSWQGVLTLAYKGFTPALLDLKARLAAALPHLPAENPGSKWPKTSLGCLGDAQRLTPDQLRMLTRICKEESAAMLRGQQIKIAVDSASVVLYECRSLERVLMVQHTPFEAGLDPALAFPEEQARVEGIVAEADDTERYWFLASRDGNRAAHYAGPHLGATLIHPLPPVPFDGSESPRGGRAARPGLRQRGLAEVQDREALLACIQRFRERVDAELGAGLYHWFADSSLHLTLRALIN